MKRVTKKLTTLKTRIENLQESLDEYRAECDLNRDKFESLPKAHKHFTETIDYIDDAYEALNTCISAISNIIQE